MSVPPLIPPATAPVTKRVLVVDDNPASTRLTRLTLEKISVFSIQELNRSTLVLESARSFRPDLVLLDIEMPGLDGGAVWRQLRADPDLCLVPILFLTSLITEAEAGVRRFDGKTGVLAKPLTLARLAAALAAQLGQLCAPERRVPCDPSGPRKKARRRDRAGSRRGQVHAELTRANEALRLVEARYQRIATNTPGMVYQFRLRPDGRFDFPFVSEGCREILRRGGATVSGTSRDRHGNSPRGGSPHAFPGNHGIRRAFDPLSLDWASRHAFRRGQVDAIQLAPGTPGQRGCALGRYHHRHHPPQGNPNRVARGQGSRRTRERRGKRVSFAHVPTKFEPRLTPSSDSGKSSGGNAWTKNKPSASRTSPARVATCSVVDEVLATARVEGGTSSSPLVPAAEDAPASVGTGTGQRRPAALDKGRRILPSCVGGAADLTIFQ